jgi:hypothetical protein
MRTILSILLLAIPLITKAQFDPPAGQPGSLAIHVSSTSFVAWANSAVVQRGWMQIGVDSLGYVSSGIEAYALGKAGENPVVSLGDGGSATLQFAHSIRNGAGPDFAVFENSFDGSFLELGFVEVSSDGENFFRFPASSLTDTSLQIAGFNYIDAKNLNNLAGKYVMLYGTPFDLQELESTSGLDINSITHVRIVDVVGSIQPQYCTRDAAGRKVNDPFPTPFMSSGFDLDAVGVIHNNDPAAIDYTTQSESSIVLFPQPASSVLHVKWNETISGNWMGEVYTSDGRACTNQAIEKQGDGFSIDVHSLKSGVYILLLRNDQQMLRKRFIIQK